MTAQINQLKAQFNNSSNAQKKEFIEKLRAKLQGKNHPEFTKLLNECVKNYNDAINIKSVITPVQNIQTTKNKPTDIKYNKNISPQPLVNSLDSMPVLKKKYVESSKPLYWGTLILYAGILIGFFIYLFANSEFDPNRATRLRSFGFSRGGGVTTTSTLRTRRDGSVVGFDAQGNLWDTRRGWETGGFIPRSEAQPINPSSPSTSSYTYGSLNRDYIWFIFAMLGFWYASFFFFSSICIFDKNGKNTSFRRFVLGIIFLLISFFILMRQFINPLTISVWCVLAGIFAFILMKKIETHQKNKLVE